MVMRRRTNNHKLSMRERLPYVLRCLWKIRRIAKSKPMPGELLDAVYGRFGLLDMYNVDQVPIEDEDSDGAYLLLAGQCELMNELCELIALL